MACNLKGFCIHYVGLTLGVWLAIPVALGLLPALGFATATVNGVILIAAAPALSSIFMAKVYVKKFKTIPPWKLIGFLMLILVPAFVVFGLWMNGFGAYLMVYVVSLTTVNVSAPSFSDIFNVPVLHIVNTAFSSILGVGVIFPIRAKGELRKMELGEVGEDKKFW